MNKLTKKLITTLLLSASFTTNIQAASIPTWTTAQQQGTSNAYLNWDVAIQPSEVIYQNDFNGVYVDLTKSITWTKLGVHGNGWRYDNRGNDTTLSNTPKNNALKAGLGYGMNGTYGIWVHDSDGGNGWNYIHFSDLGVNPADLSNISAMNLIISTGWVPAKRNKEVVFKVRAKGSGTANPTIRYDFDGNSYQLRNGLTWGETLSASEFESKLKNSTPIKVNNPNSYLESNMHLVTRNSETQDESFDFCLSTGSFYKDSNGQWYFKPRGLNKNWNGPGQRDASHYLTPAASKRLEGILWSIL